MIDNFNQISELLKFESEDDFYHLQILKRKKENPEIGSNSQVIKTYYVYSLDYLQSIKSEIVNLCEFHNARACINLNARSLERAAFHTLKKVTDIIMNRDWKSVHKAYDSVCGTFCSDREKSWIIDIDEKDMNEVNRISDIICLVEPVGNKNIAVIETKNVYHLISKPFNLSKVDIHHDIHKNNPTILYIK